MKDQYKLIDDINMVEDSIQELSKRVSQIQGFVDQQITAINKNLDQAVKTLEQRQPGAASAAQQYVMTSVNNLALMFQEIMQQMQQQMANQMAGSQMCQKPGGKKQSMQSLKQMQQQLNDQISQFSQQMKDGKMPKPGGSSMSQELAQMAAKQAAIREAIQKMNEELNKDGKNSLGNLDQLQKDMEKTETELVNKQLTTEMLKRQQEILTRLLEAENAERQRETDNKRESNSGKDMVKQLPPEIEDYLKKKQAELELYKTVPPNLKPFYRDLVEEYFKSLQQ
jgi:chromosome segregation ATPase